MAFVNIRASSNLHGGALRSVLNAPTSFFDVTPIGRIISRFSKDLHTMDTELGKCEFLNLFFCFFLFFFVFLFFCFVCSFYHQKYL